MGKREKERDGGERGWGRGRERERERQREREKERERERREGEQRSFLVPVPVWWLSWHTLSNGISLTIIS